MKALITAGGHGTRLRPITHTQNKHLIPIANKLMLDYALEYVREANIIDVAIIINAGDDSIKTEFGDGTNRNIKITYIPQDAPLGLAHVVKISEEFIKDDPFIFYLGDNILVGGISKFVSEFNKAGSNCHLALSRVPDPNRFGVAEIKDHKIIGIEEKPKTPKSNLAVTGIYLYDNNIFKAVNNIKPSVRGELEISDAHQYLLDKGYHISYSEITGWWKDTGKPSDLLEANRLVLDNIKDNREVILNNCEITGNVHLGKNVKISNSKLDGPIIINDDCIIDKAHITHHTAIGKRCEIINCKIGYSIIMSDSKIRNVEDKITNSLLGTDVQIIGNHKDQAGHRFILGDQSRIEVD
ncbi:MAG: glucose-1-phosphate thymidylyltransferase [Planctomycetia bacterium]|nr:glucose-1-phosphate thymidylyltransferase [Planctomycetia bacterium]